MKILPNILGYTPSVVSQNLFNSTNSRIEPKLTLSVFISHHSRSPLSFPPNVYHLISPYDLLQKILLILQLSTQVPQPFIISSTILIMTILYPLLSPYPPPPRKWHNKVENFLILYDSNPKRKYHYQPPSTISSISRSLLSSPHHPSYLSSSSSTSQPILFPNINQRYSLLTSTPRLF